VGVRTGAARGGLRRAPVLLREWRGSRQPRDRALRISDSLCGRECNEETGRWENIDNIIIPYVNMLIAKAAYAEGRKLVSANFTSFMKDSIAQIRGREDLAVFTNLFEAFMGYYKKYDAS